MKRADGKSLQEWTERQEFPKEFRRIHLLSTGKKKARTWWMAANEWECFKGMVVHSGKVTAPTSIDSPHSPMASASAWFFLYHKHPWIPQLKNKPTLHNCWLFFFIRLFPIVHSCCLHFLISPFTPQITAVHQTALRRSPSAKSNTYYFSGLLSGLLSFLISHRWWLTWNTTSYSSEVLSSFSIFSLILSIGDRAQQLRVWAVEPDFPTLPLTVWWWVWSLSRPVSSIKTGIIMVPDP